VAHHLAMPLDAFQRLFVSPASVSVLHFTPDGVRLISLNQRHAGV
jgi:hypothetical protein